MNEFYIQRTVYATEDGTVTHDSGGGKNRIVFLMGHSVSREEAERLKLPELDAATEARQQKVAEGSSTELKPAAASELKVEDGQSATSPRSNKTVTPKPEDK